MESADLLCVCARSVGVGCQTRTQLALDIDKSLSALRASSGCHGGAPKALELSDLIDEDFVPKTCGDASQPRRKLRRQPLGSSRLALVQT